MLHIIYFLEGSLVGDQNNTLGVARETAALYRQAEQQVTITELKTVDEAKEFIIRLERNEKPVIAISAGEVGAAKLEDLKLQLGDKVYAVWGGHQIPVAMNLGLFNRVSLPKGAASHAQKVSLGRCLTETFGVPHNLIKADLEEEYRKWQDRVPITDKKKLVVILGGNAPLPDSTQLYYKPEEAIKLANYIADLARKEGYYVYVTNGPRTGKFSHEGKEINTAHQDDTDLTQPTDPVTKAFIGTLKDKGFKDYFFVDFKRENKALKKPAISVYKAFLNIADGLVLPGESTSMISEGTDFISSVQVYLTGSMNKGHHDSLATFLSRKKIDVLSEDFVLTPSSLPEVGAPDPAALQVAKVIKEDIESRGLARSGAG
jgi:mitochondrial fission protein ELM1